MDQIAASIDAVLDSIGTPDQPDYDAFKNHGNHSVGLQQLKLAHVNKFFVDDDPIPIRVATITEHAFWLGYEAGRAAAQTAKMEEIFANAQGT